MADLINLRQARKAKARSEKEHAATQNRRAHGRTKAEKQATSLEQARAARALDGQKRIDDDPSEC